MNFGSRPHFFYALLAALVAHGFAGELPTGRAFDRFAPLPVPGAISVIDLASDHEWTARLDDGPTRPIKVPGGGWNSDKQEPVIQVMREVKDFVRYERKILIPASARGDSVEIRFGAVTYGCEIFLDGKNVGEHHGPQVAFSMDITPFVIPGQTQTLEVKAFHRRHYLANAASFSPGVFVQDGIKTTISDHTADVAVGWDFPEGNEKNSMDEAKRWCRWHGNSKVGYGILRSVDLVILPPIHVGLVFVRPSVTRNEFSANLSIRNDTAESETISLDGSFSSWNGTQWNYPAITPVTLVLPPHSTSTATLGPLPWSLGPKSYWWPNIPFSENYRAELHFLNLKLSQQGKTIQVFSQRFGFVEHSEGPWYYTVNGVRVTGFSDGTAEGQVSFYDSYSSPAWLPPTSSGTGAPESWRRYMRVGININRLHCSPPTEYMMQVADELGFMLVPEAPIWGNGLSRYSKLTPVTYHDLGLACRNHPSVARYSLANEVREPRANPNWPWRHAIDDIMTVDETRPLVFELHNQGNGRVDGINGGHAIIMEHYTNIRQRIGSGDSIRGMGEHFWSHNSMGEFAVGVRILRVNDWSYMAGWSWLNYWPNFLQGMNHEQHAWKVNNHPDRRDGIDGWNSPIMRFTRQSLDPYLVQDLEILKQNTGEPRLLSDGQIEWPLKKPTCAAGVPTERLLEVFNGALEGNRLTLRWSLHWDKPDGPAETQGGDIACMIEPGFHATEKISFTPSKPDDKKASRNLYLVLESLKDGRTVFRDDNFCFECLATPSANAEPKTSGTYPMPR